VDTHKFDDQEIKDAVRARYAKAIQQETSCCGAAPVQPVQSAGSCCGGAPVAKGTFAKIAGYNQGDLAQVPVDAVQHSFGCGNPLAFAGVQPGETVLDIGSGAGIDCFIAAEKVGPTGTVIGLDMTTEMIERARRNAREAGIGNVEFRFGEAEKMPVDDRSVDWVISNCVINLSPNKPAVFGEIGRVLRPGGRISISDIVAQDLPDAVRQSRDAWTGCLAGAISEEAYIKGLEAAGLRGVRVTSRTVYDASQLKGLFASTCCGAGEGQDPTALAEAATGKIWSAKFEGIKPQPASVVSRVSIGPASERDLPAMEKLLTQVGLPTDVGMHLPNFLAVYDGAALVGCIGMEVQGAEALFRSLAVAPAYRAVGLGRQLYQALARAARDRGIERAYLLTNTIVSLAASWGFERIERHQVPAAIRQSAQFTGTCCASAVAMRQDLRRLTAKGCCCSGT
jgi:arsenite methyltransferase